MLALFICLMILVIDQASKIWAFSSLRGTSGMNVVGEVLQFRYVENRGAAFGMLQGKMWFFYVITVVIVGFLLYYLFTTGKKSLFLNITIGLILGGAIGNFIDRLLRGFVVDFIKVDLVSFYSFPVFNVADIAITCGAILFFIYLFFIEGRATGEIDRIEK